MIARSNHDLLGTMLVQILQIADPNLLAESHMVVWQLRRFDRACEC
jgi:hypothetical protein